MHKALVSKTRVSPNSTTPAHPYEIWWTLMDSNHRVAEEILLYRQTPSATRPNAHMVGAVRFELTRLPV